MKLYRLITPRYLVYISNSLENIRQNGWMDTQNHGRTDEWMVRRKLPTPGHTSYAGGIIKSQMFSNMSIKRN